MPLPAVTRSSDAITMPPGDESVFYRANGDFYQKSDDPVQPNALLVPAYLRLKGMRLTRKLRPLGSWLTAP